MVNEIKWWPWLLAGAILTLLCSVGLYQLGLPELGEGVWWMALALTLLAGADALKEWERERQ